jgi:hypothetical protein
MSINEVTYKNVKSFSILVRHFTDKQLSFKFHSARNIKSAKVSRLMTEIWSKIFHSS